MAFISMLVGRPEIVNSASGRNLILRGMWNRVLYALYKDDSPSAIHALKEVSLLTYMSALSSNRSHRINFFPFSRLFIL